MRSPLKANLAAAEVKTPCGAAAWATGPQPSSVQTRATLALSDKCRQISIIHDKTII